MANLSAAAGFRVILDRETRPRCRGRVASTRDAGDVASTSREFVTREIRAAGGTFDIRCQLAWHGSAGGGRRVRGPSDRPGVSGSRPSRSEGTNRVEGGPAPVAQGPPKQNNSPTPLLGTAMISYFWRGAVFFSPLRYSGGTRTVRGRVTHVGLARLF